MDVNSIIPDDYYKAEHVGGRGCDLEWIKEQLDTLKPQQRLRAVEGYTEAYRNSGRSEANARLREFAERCKNLKSGSIAEPNIVK